MASYWSRSDVMSCSYAFFLRQWRRSVKMMPVVMSMSTRARMKPKAMSMKRFRCSTCCFSSARGKGKRIDR